MTKNSKQFFIHFLVWFLFIAAVTLQLYLDKNQIPKQFLIRIWIGIFLFYINYLILVPKLLLKRKLFLYILVATLLVTGVTYIHQQLNLPFYYDNIQKQGRIRITYAISVLFNSVLIVIGAISKMYFEWNKSEAQKKRIEAQKKSSELKALKNQVNPHFLFNSLNSIYSLTVKQSKEASASVIMLSELMRYMLYETDKKWVLLENELSYIENYVNLQRLRIANNENVKLTIKGEIRDQKISPLLLISFIENAFKYGTDISGKTNINITIEIQDNFLEFKCENSIGHKKKHTDNSGIGLQNTKEQLELIFPNKYELFLDENRNKFTVHLKLNLD